MATVTSMTAVQAEPTAATAESTAADSTALSSSDNFEAVAAAVESNPELQPVGAVPVEGAQAGAGASDAKETASTALLCSAVTPEHVTAWLDAITKTVAMLVGDPSLELQTHERAMIVPAVTVIADRELPALIKAKVSEGASPEYTMLMFGLLAYASRVGGAVWKKQQAKKNDETRAALSAQNSREPSGVAVASAPKSERDFTAAALSSTTRGYVASMPT